MKFSIISSALIVAATAVFAPSLRSGEVVIKHSPRELQATSAPLFAERVAPVAGKSCPACKTEAVATVTQDTKLKNKTILVESHACKACKTTIVRTGAQKATGKDVSQHTCGGLVAAVESCCGMK